MFGLPELASVGLDNGVAVEVRPLKTVTAPVAKGNLELDIPVSIQAGHIGQLTLAEMPDTSEEQAA